MLIENIDHLVQIEIAPLKKLRKGAEMLHLNTIENAFLLIEEGKIAGFGKMEELPDKMRQLEKKERLDATCKMVFPSFVDSHTHHLYPKSREV
mgnify:CR=1 FL=1